MVSAHAAATGSLSAKDPVSIIPRQYSRRRSRSSSADSSTMSSTVRQKAYKARTAERFSSGRNPDAKWKDLLWSAVTALACLYAFLSATSPAQYEKNGRVDG